MTYKTLGKPEENGLRETSDYVTVASCPPIPRPLAHAPNKQGGKPAGQDTSSYCGSRTATLTLQRAVNVQTTTQFTRSIHRNSFTRTLDSYH